MAVAENIKESGIQKLPELSHDALELAFSARNGVAEAIHREQE